MSGTAHITWPEERHSSFLESPFNMPTRVKLALVRLWTLVLTGYSSVWSKRLDWEVNTIKFNPQKLIVFVSYGHDKLGSSRIYGGSTSEEGGMHCVPTRVEMLTTPPRSSSASLTGLPIRPGGLEAEKSSRDIGDVGQLPRNRQNPNVLPAWTGQKHAYRGDASCRGRSIQRGHLGSSTVRFVVGRFSLMLTSEEFGLSNFASWEVRLASEFTSTLESRLSFSVPGHCSGMYP